MYVKKKNNTELKVTVSTTLLPFLMEKMTIKRTGAKQLLAHRQVLVNKVCQTRFDALLSVGDLVTIVSGKGNIELKHPKLKLVYEDDHLLVVEKKQGLLTVPTRPGSTETTVSSILRAYLRRQNPRAGIYVVHRLDRETSGLLVFAKSEKLQEYMRTYWRQIVTKRTYIAVAEGQFQQKEGKITTWLTEDKRNAVVYSSPVDDGGDIAITNYEVLKQSDMYSLVELHLETGRTNQIRVHLQSLGHPVLGDRKYGHGNEIDPKREGLPDRLCLHARALEFIHPVTEQVVRFETTVPKEFARLFTPKNH